MNANPTQCEKILDYMQKHDGITPLEAEVELGIMRLASRQHELIKQGHKIKKEFIKGKNRHGEPTRYMKYSLES